MSSNVSQSIFMSDGRISFGYINSIVGVCARYFIRLILYVLLFIRPISFYN
nr:MAG TPA: hypothetical protein [Caudoviricetes sp.]